MIKILQPIKARERPQREALFDGVKLEYPLLKKKQLSKGVPYSIYSDRCHNSDVYSDK